ncbi:uncharacterized protein [Ptychodera flava]|uniref:uncharacterized protein n=1 Tax=Ptychodera flava TaxID=63121 RepID=UPI00396A010C
MSDSPLLKLYQRLRETITIEEENEIRRILEEVHIPKRVLFDQLHVGAIMQCLQNKGKIGPNDLTFVKDLLKAVNRKNLISEVEKCEEELKNWTDQSMDAQDDDVDDRILRRRSRLNRHESSSSGQLFSQDGYLMKALIIFTLALLLFKYYE